MGTKNADLIRATVRADQAAKFLSGLVLISQEECPHPADKQRTDHLGKVCRDCSKGDPIMVNPYRDMLRLVQKEAGDAHAKFGAFASMHEAYGVLIEEVDEMFEAIRLKQDVPQRGDRIEKEAVQVAAVALRIAMQARGNTR